MTRCTILATLLAAASGCGGGDAELTVYLPQRLGPEGPHGQIAPVLAPVARERRAGMSSAWQAVLELRVGPSPAERARGFRGVLDPRTRLRAIRARGDLATVDLAGKEPTYPAAAAIVLSLTERSPISTVRLRLDGQPCCFYLHSGRAVGQVDRRTFRGWSGEPCHLRAYPDAQRCRR